MKSIPRRLKSAREHAGVSVAAMAAALNVSRKTVRKIETPSNDIPDIGLATIAAYAEKTGASLEYLIFGHTLSQQTALRLFKMQDEINSAILRAHEELKGI